MYAAALMTCTFADATTVLPGGNDESAEQNDMIGHGDGPSVINEVDDNEGSNTYGLLEPNDIYSGVVGIYRITSVVTLTLISTITTSLNS